jgi:hypothetical protein
MKIKLNNNKISFVKKQFIISPPYFIIGNKMVKLYSRYWIKQNENKVSFLFIDKKPFKIFIKNLLYFYNLFYSLYFYRLKMKGLGFRIVKIALNFYRFFFNQTNYFYFYIPKNIIMLYKKRNLLFVGLNWDILKIVIIHVLLLKKLTIYRTRGLIYPRQIRILKPGKKRF